MKLSSIFRTPLSLLKHLFLSGLFTLLPIALTAFFISFIYNFVYKFLQPLRDLEPEILRNIPGVEFVIATCSLLLLGIILRVFIFHSIVNYFEKLIIRIPLIRIIYSSAKMLVDFFRVSKEKPQSREVVLVAFPRAGMYHLGFLLESAYDNYQKLIPEKLIQHKGEVFHKVFLPTSPNPTTGYFLIVPESEIIRTPITFEEAIKTLVSCGLMTPETVKMYQKNDNIVRFD